jgi:hypothetical protein
MARPASLLLALVCCVCVAIADRPAVRSVVKEGTNLTLTIDVPPGVQKLTLEGKPNVGRKTWEPRAVRHLPAPGEQQLSIPLDGGFQVFRFRGETNEVLPASFFSGNSDFQESVREISAGGSGSGSTGGGWDGGTSGGMTGGTTAGPSGNTTGGTGGGGPMDSDVWQIAGNKAYYFNQNRGLQKIDISDPATPRLESTLLLNEHGLQLFLLENDIVLLISSDCNWRPSLRAIDMKAEPRVLWQRSIGWMYEARLIGTDLFLVAPESRENSTADGLEHGTEVLCLDLSEISTPRLRASTFLPLWGIVSRIHDRYILIAGSAIPSAAGTSAGTFSAQNGSTHTIYPLACVSLDSLRSGEPKAILLETTGHPAKKGFLHEENGILTVLSEDLRPAPQGGLMNVAFLETFAISEPSQARRLGVTSFAAHDRLFDAKFDRNVVYVVSSDRTGPIHLLDLRDPQSPRIAQQLALPGRTTFLQPLPESRLLAVGYADDKNETFAASLFEINEAETARLLDRVQVGKQFSASANTFDEKVHAYFPDANLALIPYKDEQSQSKVSFLEIGQTNLIVRSSLEHRFAPRRSTLAGQTLITFSPVELLTINTANFDQPVFQGRAPLADSVDELFEFDGHIVEIGYGDSRFPPEIRLLKNGAVADRLVLANTPIVRVERRDNFLYLAHANSLETSAQPSPEDRTMRLTVVELSAPAALRLRGSVAFEGFSVTWQEQHRFLWTSDRTLVWCVNPPRPQRVVEPPSGGLGWGGEPGSGGWGGSITIQGPTHGGKLGAPTYFVFDLANPDAPTLASKMAIDPKDKTNFSESFASADTLYVSYLLQLVAKQPNGQLKITERTELSVVDLSSPDDPVTRIPIALPANLVGQTHQGSILYTAGFDFLPDGTQSTNIFLTVLAYDGVSVHQVDRTTIPHLASEFIKTRSGSLYFVENRPLEGRLTEFRVGKIPVLRKEAEVGLGLNSIARVWEFNDRQLGFGNWREIGFISLTDRKLGPTLNFQEPASCRWWFNPEQLVQTSAGYIVPIGYFNPLQLLEKAAP